jgi:hypothetical protein
VDGDGFCNKYAKTPGFFLYIVANMMTLMISMLNIPASFIPELCGQLRTIDVIKQPFEVVYHMTFSSYSKLTAILPENNLDIGKIFKCGEGNYPKIQIELLAGNVIRTGIITSGFFTHGNRFIIRDFNSYGSLVFDTLFNLIKWSNLESLMELDKTMTLRRLTWGLPYEGDIVNLLDTEGAWHKVLGLSALISFSLDLECSAHGIFDVQKMTFYPLLYLVCQ